MSYPPGGHDGALALTDEQRAASLEKAAAARRARTELREKLKQGSITLRDVLDRAQTDETLGKMKVTAVLEALPGVGKVRAQRIIERLAIASSRRLRGLSDRHRREILAEFDTPQSTRSVESDISITVFISNESIHEQVEQAVEALLAFAGIQVEHMDDPIFGSWLRRMRGKAADAARSPLAREVALTAAHAADVRLSLAQDADVTSIMMKNLGPVLAALQPTKDAVIRVGALLIVKVNWIVGVHQLTAAQQLRLDHQPDLVASPSEILTTLALEAEAVPSELEADTAPRELAASRRVLVTRADLSEPTL